MLKTNNSGSNPDLPTKLKLKQMMRRGSRTIKVNKQKLINQIKENKERHIEEYKEAKIFYKEEALKQLMNLKSRVDANHLDIRLDLVTPIDNSDNYDKIIQMFEWEVNEEVELEQNEFIEYVQDETDFAVTAKFSNQAYSLKGM